MNYSMSPSPYVLNRNYGNHLRYTRRHPTWAIGSGHHASDQARYVHANYRFIVDPRADYHPQAIDSDVHTDWSNVLQILVSSRSQSTSCPICLGDPVSPRMAKCGHIFCLPCLIRYMHSEDDSQHVPEKRARSKKCPLCWDSIYISETRPVRFYTGQEGEPLREGMDVVLRLVMRSSSSTLALPRDGAAAPEKEDIPWYFAAEVMDYARFMKGTEEYMQEQFDTDILALEIQEKEDELMFGEDNVEWSQKAIRMIKEAKEKVKGIGGPVSTPMKPVEPELEAKRPPIEFTNTNSAPEMYTMQHAAHSGQSLSEVTTTGPASTAPHTQETKSNPTSATETTTTTPTTKPHTTAIHKQPATYFHAHGTHTPSEYYFYQALLHYYLSPLDIRILREAFGPYASFPATILPKVERVLPRVVDDDVRKRTKWLSHLPYGCEVNFLECDWTDTVPPEVLDKFKGEIETRRRRNEEKEAREEKARLLAEKEEDEKRYAHLRRRRPEIELEQSSNAFSQEDFQPLVTAEAMDSTDNADADNHSTSPPWSNHRQGASFASLATMSTSPNTTRTVWGTPAVPSSSPQLVAAPPEPEDDGWLQGWEKDLLQEEDLVTQAQSLSLSGDSSRTGGTTSSGKKKKAKKITLMSTNVRRGA